MKEFEKSDSYSTRTITSSYVLCEKETGRVVATFYDPIDLECVLSTDNRDKIIDECISKIQSCELVEPNVMRIRLDEAIGSLVDLKAKLIGW